MQVIRRYCPAQLHASFLAIVPQVFGAFELRLASAFVASAFVTLIATNVCNLLLLYCYIAILLI